MTILLVILFLLFEKKIIKFKYNKIKRNILPIAEFVSTTHTTDSIGGKLADIIGILEMQSVEIAPFTVTDNSWAMTGSILKAFNGQSPASYINLCFDILIKYSQNSNVEQLRALIRTRTLLCCTHYLKNFIKEIKRKTQFENKKQKNKRTNKVIQMIIYCFTLLQDCSTIYQFDQYLHEIFILFNSQYKNELVELSLKVFISILENLLNLIF